MSGWDDLAGIVTIRPLSEQLPTPTYTGWNGTPFNASWTSTVQLLVDETRALKPQRVVLELDLARGELDLRRDGMPRAQARTATPGVIVSLIGTPHGDLRYPCSTFHDWQSNVRGIALALEALRKVDRYGVTKRGEQYAGWKQLPAPTGEPSAERGRRLVEEHGGVRAALMATHPDRGGDPAAFADVQAYRQEVDR